MHFHFLLTALIAHTLIAATAHGAALFCRDGSKIPRVIKLNPKGLFDPTPLNFTQISIDTRSQIAYIAGQTSINRKNEIIGNMLQEQIDQIGTNIKIALRSLSAENEDIVSMGVFIVDYSQERDLPVLNTLTPSIGSPVSTLVGVQSLALPGLLAEIEFRAAVAKRKVRKIACKKKRAF